MARALSLYQRVAFDRPVKGGNGYGGTRVGWSPDDEAIKVRAHFRFLRGGEQVQAARLEGRQPVVVTVRNSEETRAIRGDWRMRDLTTGEIYNIRSGPLRTDNRLYLEFTMESGVAA